jgi:type 1 glutamine amidotransferase
LIRKILRFLMWLVLALLLLAAAFVAWNWDMFQRIFMGGVKVYETSAPPLPADLPRPAILVFSKTNGFRHEEAIPAANAMFAQIAREKGWGYVQTENGATFSSANLARFDAVVFNNVSGDVFTPEQRTALKGFIEHGGGFVGVHGAGGDNQYAWRWYVDSLIGAQFIGHPMDPQFQQATVKIEDKSHPATATLPDTLLRTDEWYSFAASPRRAGVRVLATLDEATYSPNGFFGSDLRMGADHPIAWWHCEGTGRTLYTAMGHNASAYAEPAYRSFLLGATEWAIAGKDCAAPAPKN